VFLWEVLAKETFIFKEIFLFILAPAWQPIRFFVGVIIKVHMHAAIWDSAYLRCSVHFDTECNIFSWRKTLGLCLFKMSELTSFKGMKMRFLLFQAATTTKMTLMTSVLVTSTAKKSMNPYDDNFFYDEITKHHKYAESQMATKVHFNLLPH
jgi:hypothetical protein